MPSVVLQYCKDNGRYIKPNAGNGNCGPLALADCLRETVGEGLKEDMLDMHNIRQTVWSKAMEEIKFGNSIFGTLEIIHSLREDKTFWTEGMLAAAAIVYKVNIILVSDSPSLDRQNGVHEYNSGDEESPTIHIGHIHAGQGPDTTGHFVALLHDSNRKCSHA